MSRGPGKWQRLLLHQLYHEDRKVNPYVGAVTIRVGRQQAGTPSELSAVYRAARVIKAKGWSAADNSPYASRLARVNPPPPVATRDGCELCKRSQVGGNESPDNAYRAEVMGEDGKFYPMYKRSQIAQLRRICERLKRGRCSVTPDYAVYDGHGFTVEVIEPHWIYASRITDLSCGLSWLAVYRSPELRDTDDKYRPVREMIGDAEPLEFSVIPDDDMMFGRGELSVYAL